ncbi:hypothetical protein V498_07473 [Pseudogymnoascus sp. VKM F-4517 (FW-2822)]|nr:hypothetical protein V498_07473 [Pseudogymnoascus sp. VKM F-4517 (FW-2822)]
MAGSWSIFIGFVVIVLACVAAWFFSPKGENQTVWRSTLILSFASCYIIYYLPRPATPSHQPQKKQLAAGICVALRWEYQGSRAARSYRGLPGALRTQRI